MSLMFARDGAERIRAVLSPGELADIAALFDLSDGAGARLTREALAPIAETLTASGSIGRLAEAYGGAGSFPVRAILLNKTPNVNWRLGWHQDRVVAVTTRVDLPGFSNWTIKDGQHHVQPPQALVNRLVTMRVHVDAVDSRNAPLRILPGSHRAGRLSESAIARLADEVEAQECLADVGDVWVYRTPIIHSSGEQQSRGSRRVLQLDYAAFDLPGGLQWALS